MPWGDRTGPMGLGPMTGRGAGFCAGFPVPGFANPWVGGFGRGRGRGRGFGFRRGYYPFGSPGYGYSPFASPYSGSPPYSGPPPYYGEPQSAQDEAQFLKDQADLLQKDLEEINRRIQELESEKKTKK